MKIRIRYTPGRLAEVDRDYPMNSPEETIRIAVGRDYEPSSGLPMVSLIGRLPSTEVWEYRLAGYLPGEPEVPCYRFSRVLPA
ncbi:hypothetical protein [Pseudomonas sp. UBA2684]|uniref:hypothetical protein n=1 Tax=Pseudomonas sp. UBA2684 TaxID=1947311 RepID=UPI000E7FD468|nr:hypothetical protein [Pseudomonas sp. UBA2684]HBX54100.1 hypothetical protein [Pseudomonas sp.]